MVLVRFLAAGNGRRRLWTQPGCHSMNSASWFMPRATGPENEKRLMRRRCHLPVFTNPGIPSFLAQTRMLRALTSTES